MIVTMHFPINLESHYHPPEDRPPKWQFHKAFTKNIFKYLCSVAFLHDNLEVEDQCPICIF